MGKELARELAKDCCIGKTRWAHSQGTRQTNPADANLS
jgi:hypothetical protein